MWPASNRERPKWELRLSGRQSLLEQAWERARAVAPAADCRVVAGVAQAALVRRSLPELPAQNLLVEPVPRDTAGAIALAAAAIQIRNPKSQIPNPKSEIRNPKSQIRNSKSEIRNRKSKIPNAVMLVLPGDHIISPVSRFRECVLAGASVAVEQGALVTFGIVPRKPATGYGYIHCGKEIRAQARIQNPKSKIQNPKVFQALSFREKPDPGTAERYVASGDYYWNGGIFLWTLETLRAEFERQLGGHAALIRALSTAQPGGRKWASLVRKRFPALPKISIDFGIMEHARNVAAVAGDFEWDDIGSWSAVGEHLGRQDGNACAAGARLFSLDARGNVVFAPEKRVALIGVAGLAVVASGEDILVCKLERDQDVRRVASDE